MTDAQRATAMRLGVTQSKKFNWDLSKGALGHSEMNPGHRTNEGEFIAQSLRSGKYKEFLEKNGGFEKSSDPTNMNILKTRQNNDEYKSDDISGGDKHSNLGGAQFAARTPDFEFGRARDNRITSLMSKPPVAPPSAPKEDEPSHRESRPPDDVGKPNSNTNDKKIKGSDSGMSGQNVPRPVAPKDHIRGRVPGLEGPGPMPGHQDNSNAPGTQYA